ncbi:phosphodiester glycosidase family protein [Echinicola strongylocentroti]|uniref:Phosphodiester glycosidase family protein n=1 Tax=Echinicola strongylocentroti TaxID=1795355 RepID=A0A2Z4IPK4_9BACT|nr:phosphodiester glycosidase family protein [Echinicola strongylocentroti]AWW33002.1 phosphodiester glycosidase family protein [Echinicola strongylocentroti]
MKKYINYYYTFLLATSMVLMAASCKNDDTQPAVLDQELSPITQRLADSTELVSEVFWDTTFTVAPGVEETDIHYLSMKGLTMRMFVVKIDLKEEGVELFPLTPFASSGFGMQPIPEMMEWVDVPGKKVVGGVNADFFNMDTGEPRGVVHLHGEAIKTTPMVGRSFFGVDENGRLVIEHSDDYPEFQDGLYDALGAGDLLIKDYNLVPIPSEDIHPRTAVGITDAEEVYFMVVDGRLFDYSNGLSLSEVAEVFQALGVRDATNLDGGGSSTFVTLHSLEDVFHVRNRPSDGTPRPVANGWAILVNENE